MTRDPTKPQWLIKKGAYWYRPRSAGYTQYKFDAGRYTFDEAMAEASVEPWHMKAVHEDDVPEDNFVDKEIARLRSLLALAELSASALMADRDKHRRISRSRLEKMRRQAVRIAALERRLGL